MVSVWQTAASNGFIVRSQQICHGSLLCTTFFMSVIPWPSHHPVFAYNITYSILYSTVNWTGTIRDQKVSSGNKRFGEIQKILINAVLDLLRVNTVFFFVSVYHLVGYPT